jgi:hypothetical protein
VFVVKAGGTVEYRPVAIRRSTTDIAVVDAGLAPGETVVTDGHLSLIQGSKVKIETDLKGTAASQNSPASEPAGSPPAGTATAERGGRS